MKNPRITTMLQIAGKHSGPGVNDKLMGSWRAMTGGTVFKPIKKWNQEGKRIKRGEKGYPVFSTPKQDPDSGKITYSIRFLFHEGQLR